MWAIRILTGPQAGQIFPLSSGKHTLGRSQTCEVKLASNSVSKEHASLLVTEDKLIISDLNSRNGTYVNGVRIQNQRIGAGDKLSLHDIMLDVVEMPDVARPLSIQAGTQSRQITTAPAWAGNAALRLQTEQKQTQQLHAAHDLHLNHDMQAQMNSHLHEQESQQPALSANTISDLLGNVQVYIDHVAMPGVYALVKSMPYRWALALMVGVFVVAITALSIVPVVATTKKNIQGESIRRAKTIARVMRDNNKRFIADHNEVQIDVHAAEVEEGVTAALIINAKDGTILAPANKRGEFANKPFVNQARREEREFADFIDDSQLGVSIPIMFYNPETGSQSVAAYAIVLYDTGALAMPPGQTISLFIQTLAIALFAGALLFFFLFKIIERPLELINADLDDALREGRDDLRTDFHLPVLEHLVSNINSALSRVMQGGDQSAPMAPVVNRELEAANLVRMLPLPALAVNAIDDRVIACNPAFEKLVGGGIALTGRPISDIPDVALQQNLIELLPKMRNALGEIAVSEIPFSGTTYEICGQAVMNTNEPGYYLISLSRVGGDYS